MKLFRYGEIGTEKSAVLHADGTLRAVLPFVQDIDATVLSPEGIRLPVASLHTYALKLHMDGGSAG